MLDIFIYAFGIMYSPGPANTLALFAGVNGQGWRGVPYCFGVGLAMLIWFLFVSYLGVAIMPSGYQTIIGLTGGAYIAYLAIKILRASFQPSANKTTAIVVSFKTGLMLQLFNPKSLVAIVPIVTVQFPRLDIEGGHIALWCLILSTIAFGAPSAYLMAGSSLKKTATKPNAMAWINRVMASLLLLVAYRFVFA